MPTILREGPGRLYFYSHEPNDPLHIHVDRDAASCKFWLDPVDLAKNIGFSPVELSRIRRMVKTHQTTLLEAWHDNFGH